MKQYKNRKELEDDVLFLKFMLNGDVNKLQCDLLISELFTQWMETSPDSPWNDNNEEDLNAAEALLNLVKKEVHFNENFISDEWKGQHTIFNEVNSMKTVRSNHYNLRNL